MRRLCLIAYEWVKPMWCLLSDVYRSIYHGLSFPSELAILTALSIYLPSHVMASPSMVPYPVVPS